jgi:hypothetical protein
MSSNWARPAGFLKAALALACMAAGGPVDAFDNKPIGCQGAKFSDVNTEKLVYLQQGMGVAECGRGEKAVDCTRSTYPFEMANQPVHEAITRQAYREVRRRPITTLNFDSPLITGVVWNDDPEWMLRKAWHNHGPKQISRFADVMKRGAADPSLPELSVRSHFGDLQFLHAMRGLDQTEAESRKRLRAWITAAHEVATGRLASTSSIKNSAFQEALGSFACHLRDPSACTIRDLLDEEGRLWKHVERRVGELNMRWLAAGTVLHILQDANSASHTVSPAAAAPLPSRKSLTYDADNRRTHCWSDMATVNSKANIDAALRDSIEYLRLLENKAPTDQVMALLDKLGLPALPE